MKLADMAGLIAEHPFVQIGIREVEDSYRELQAARKEYGPYDMDCLPAEEGFRSALGVLLEQMVGILGFDRDDVYACLVGHVRERCGGPDNPKLWDEWNFRREARNSKEEKVGGMPEAALAYGYDLGNFADGWRFKEVDEYGDPDVGWYGGEGDFAAAARKRLGGRHDGVAVREHGYREDPRYALCAFSVSRDWDESGEPVEIAWLADLPGMWGMNSKLSAALKILGVTPARPAPGWLLLPYGRA